ncbi:MAG: DUF600 family protein [Eubacteriales bacterium]
MAQDLFQEIYREISGYFPQTYEKIVFFTCHSESHCRMEFFVIFSETQWVKCYNLQGVEDEDLMDSFDKINLLIDSVKESEPVMNSWDMLTITFQETGEFSSEYEYIDENFDEYSHEVIWRYKYLKEIPLKENAIAHKIVTEYIKKS